MRLRKKKWAKPELEKDQKVVFNPTDYKGIWKECFGNDHPIHLELGCGRGKFISQLAASNPKTNYIAIDIHNELLVYVLRKVNENKSENIRILPMYIEKIGEVFAPKEIERIYINFCNPWPNKRHHKRRLTHPNFLRVYKSFLKPGSEIWFKTDDDQLFEDSLDYFKHEGFEAVYKTVNLHNCDYKGTLMTEYEEKFMTLGIRIKFAIFKICP